MMLLIGADRTDRFLHGSQEVRYMDAQITRAKRKGGNGGEERINPTRIARETVFARWRSLRAKFLSLDDVEQSNKRRRLNALSCWHYREARPAKSHSSAVHYSVAHEREWYGIILIPVEPNARRLRQIPYNGAVFSYGNLMPVRFNFDRY